MNNLKIKESIKAYKKYLEQNNQAMEDLKARKEKISFYQKFKKDVLLNLKEEEFVEFIGKLWASAIYGSKKYLVDKMISTNKGFQRL